MDGAPQTVSAQPADSDHIEVKSLLEWSAPLRVFKPLDRENFTRLVVWSLVLSLVLIFFKEFVLVLAIFALLFFSYVMGTVPPQVIKHRITENGLTTAGHAYLWSELKDFYFIKRLGQTILMADTSVRPARLILVLQGVGQEEVKKTLSPFISYREEVPRGTLDSLTEKAAQLLNLA